MTRGITALAGLFTALLVSLGWCADDPKPPMLTPDEQKLADEATKLHLEGVQLYQRGRPAEASVKLQEALEMRKKLFSASQYPGGHRDLATSYAWMGFVLREIGQAEKAVTYFQLSVDINRKLFPASKYPDGHPDLASSLNGMGFVLHTIGQAEKALPFYQQSLEMRQKLVTLSACETGLGEDTGGEGVQGLQRAFHLAGCPNVVASLWKVNDAATAALMSQFYHELWVNKKPPIEALREAQLTIYRHPERIQDLVGERGRPALDAAAKLGSATTTKPDEKPKTPPVKLWAGFVLSGVGK
jgi:tetratricopeptide (TPR) repeat protein